MYPQDVLSQNCHGLVLLNVGLAFLLGSFVFLKLWGLVLFLQKLHLFHLITCELLQLYRGTQLLLKGFLNETDSPLTIIEVQRFTW